jgi:hypothetical protein
MLGEGRHVGGREACWGKGGMLGEGRHVGWWVGGGSLVRGKGDQGP